MPLDVLVVVPEVILLLLLSVCARLGLLGLVPPILMDFLDHFSLNFVDGALGSDGLRRQDSIPLSLLNWVKFALGFLLCP